MPRERDVPRTAVGVRDIARQLGVSVGTVDRALHDKPGVKADTRARVLAAARHLGYTPNLAARYLRSRTPLRIAVQLPERSSFFWETLRDGIREAAAPFAPSLGLDFGTEARAWTPGPALPPRSLDRQTAGLIVAPGAPDASAPRLEECARRNIRVASVAGNVPDSPRLLSVSVDAFSVGALAGELMGRFVPLGGDVAVVVGSVATRAHAEAMRGFSASLSRFSVPLKLVEVLESHLDERETHRRMLALLRTHRRLRGLYVGTGASFPVLDAARDEGRLAGLAVVTTDLCPELFDWIRSGTVAATIYERPLTQGHVALQMLYQYVQTGVLPMPHRQAIAPYAVMSSNLDILLQRLAIARAVTVSGDDTVAPPEP